MLACGCLLPAAAQQHLYVSPQGNDQWNGEKSTPFQSIERAIEAATSGTDTLYIEVAAGDYPLSRPLHFGPSVRRPVVVRGSGQSMPRLLGGRRIEGWQRYRDNIYRAYIPEVKLYDYDFEQFYVNGRRAVWARTPNQDWFYVKGQKEYPYAQGVRAASYATQRITLGNDGIAALKGLPVQELADVRFRFYHKWDITQKRAVFACPDSGYVFIHGNGMNPWNAINGGSRYVMYGYRRALDAPGEWYLDRKEGYLYYIPLPGEDLATAECVAPTLHQWVTVEGKKGQPAGNLRFENLSFRYSAYRMPALGCDPVQAAAPTEAAIELEQAHNVSFTGCEMMHTGGYAVWMKAGTRHNRIDSCYLADLGAGGIKIGEPWFPADTALVSRFNTVNNSIITHAGSELPCGVGVAIFHASDNRVTHNEISDLRYSGVSVGWAWGYNHSDATWTNTILPDGRFDFMRRPLVSPAVRNLVAYNHIHHIGWGELSDMGAVYTLGESQGTRIVHNVIHDVLSYDYGGWGLYTDEGSTGVEMSHNLVYRCKSGGFHQHYGKDNRIENNIFAFGHYYQAQYSRVEPHLSFHFRHNIILQDKGATLAGPWEQGNLDIDYNLYWHVNGEPKVGNHPFKEWKKLKEKHSVMADPLFVDAANDDFRLRSTKAVRKIGFKPFDFENAGVYGSDAWKARAQMPKELADEFAAAARVRLKK